MLAGTRSLFSFFLYTTSFVSLFFAYIEIVDLSSCPDWRIALSISFALDVAIKNKHKIVRSYNNNTSILYIWK